MRPSVSTGGRCLSRDYDQMRCTRPTVGENAIEEARAGERPKFSYFPRANEATLTVAVPGKGYSGKEVALDVRLTEVTS